MARDKIIVFGTNGMLGIELSKDLAKHKLYAYSKSDVNISDSKKIASIINRIKPDIVINAAAYTNVDGCEKNKRLALKVNADAVKILAKECKKNNSVLVHFSTDYVFGGKKKGYKEDDKTNPINAYGHSKALGEKYLTKTMRNYYLIRTSWLFGKRNGDFVSAILNLARQKKEIGVVDDQFGSPTYAKDLSKKVKHILESKKPYGTYHVTNSGVCTWLDFAKLIIKLSGLNKKLKPITSAEWKKPAKRPKYSVLLNTKLSPLRTWRLALKDYMKELKWKE